MRAWLATLSLAAGLAGSACPAFALTPAEVSQRVAANWGVEVLKVRPTRAGDQDALAVTVMSPGGSFNGALGVTTLLVDPQTGELLSQFRHGTSGYSLPADQPGPQRAVSGWVIRERGSR